MRGNGFTSRIGSGAAPVKDRDHEIAMRRSNDTIDRIDPVLTRLRGGRNRVLHRGFISVMNNADATVSQLDHATGDLLGEIPVTADSYDLAAGHYGPRAVLRIEP